MSRIGRLAPLLGVFAAVAVTSGCATGPRARTASPNATFHVVQIDVADAALGDIFPKGQSTERRLTRREAVTVVERLRRATLADCRADLDVPYLNGSAAAMIYAKSGIAKMHVTVESRLRESMNPTVTIELTSASPADARQEPHLTASTDLGSADVLAFLPSPGPQDQPGHRLVILAALDYAPLREAKGTWIDLLDWSDRIKRHP